MRFIEFNPKVQTLIFGKSNLRFEDKLILFVTFFVGAILALCSISNFLLGLPVHTVLMAISGSLLYFSLYFFGRFSKINNLFVLFCGIVSILYFDLLWFYNYGSNGPILFAFIVLFTFLILVFDKKYFFLIFVSIFLNLVCLFFIELEFSKYIGNYSTPMAHMGDSYIGILVAIGVNFSFIAVIKRNYIYESERAKMSDQLKSAFLANMSHEIRTPLNSIVGFSSLIADQDITMEEKKSFEMKIHQNSDYLLNLIEDIIDVSKIESNQLTINKQEVDVVPLIKQVAQSFQLNFQEDKELRILPELPDAKLVVKTDHKRLEQILRNLLSNAVKFTEKGQITVGCKKESDFFVFSVKDTGIGIKKEDQQLIFERFRKIESHKQNLFRGTGIGLFLSKQLVELFGGTIWVESEVGKGSVFHFTLPV